jgi:hypothetical protein
MKTMSATNFKKNFSALLKQMTACETIALTKDKTNEIIRYFTVNYQAGPKFNQVFWKEKQSLLSGQIGR